MLFTIEIAASPDNAVVVSANIVFYPVNSMLIFVYKSSNSRGKTAHLSFLIHMEDCEPLFLLGPSAK